MSTPRPAPAPLGAYVNALTAAGTCYVSGQVPVDHTGQTVGAGDIQAQARQVFSNLAAVLAEHAMTLRDVVSLTTYLTNLHDNAVVAQVRQEFLADHRPTSTVVGVAGLLKAEWLLEISAVAVRSAGADG